MEHRAFRVVAVGLLTSVALPCQLRAQVGAAPGSRTPTSVRRVAGCYQLTTGAWSGALPAHGLPDVQRPPAWFALDSVHLARSRDALYAVQPARLGPPSNRPASWPRTPAFWRPVGADSVSIAWSNGYMGVGLLVAVRGDSLIGIARTFQDAHSPGEPPAPEARVVAVRVPCVPDHRGRAGDTGE